MRVCVYVCGLRKIEKQCNLSDEFITKESRRSNFSVLIILHPDLKICLGFELISPISFPITLTVTLSEFERTYEVLKLLKTRKIYQKRLIIWLTFKIKIKSKNQQKRSY